MSIPDAYAWLTPMHLALVDILIATPEEERANLCAALGRVPAHHHPQGLEVGAVIAQDQGRLLALAEHVAIHKKTIADLEAILLVIEEPVMASILAETVYETEEIVEDLLGYIQARYRVHKSGMVLRKLAGGYRLWTNVTNAQAVEAFVVTGKSGKLSRAMTETLAIIAFKQPITRMQIGAIRGVDADVAVRNLMSRGLIGEAGRLDDPGRPMTYATTPMFLELLGLGSLDDLPPLDTFAPAGAIPPEPAITAYKTARKLVDMMDDPKAEAEALHDVLAKADRAMRAVSEGERELDEPDNLPSREDD